MPLSRSALALASCFARRSTDRRWIGVPIGEGTPQILEQSGFYLSHLLSSTANSFFGAPFRGTHPIFASNWAHLFSAPAAIIVGPAVMLAAEDAQVCGVVGAAEREGLSMIDLQEVF